MEGIRHDQVLPLMRKVPNVTHCTKGGAYVSKKGKMGRGVTTYSRDDGSQVPSGVVHGSDGTALSGVSEFGLEDAKIIQAKLAPRYELRTRRDAGDGRRK